MERSVRQFPATWWPLSYSSRIISNLWLIKADRITGLRGPERFAEHGGRTLKGGPGSLLFFPARFRRRPPASVLQLAGFIVMPVGSSGNWYARHWYMGAYFTRLAEPASSTVCYLARFLPRFHPPLLLPPSPCRYTVVSFSRCAILLLTSLNLHPFAWPGRGYQRARWIMPVLC